MSSPRILVIDDDPMITRLLQEHLTEEGYEVASVHLAEQGFQTALKSPPDLIFLDVMLPDATGFQTVARFRKEPATSAIPIIMMSGTARNANQLGIAKSMGATDYFVKPFDVIQVGERVGQLVQQKPIPRKSAASVPVVESKPAVAPEPDLKSVPDPEQTAPAAHELEPLFTPMEAPKKIELISMQDLTPLQPSRIQPEIKKETVSWTLPDRPSVEMAPAPKQETSLPHIEIEDENMGEAKTMFTLPSSDHDSERMSSTKPHNPWMWMITPLIFILHLGATYWTADKNALLSLSYTAGGWALFLGCLVAACGIVRISITAEEALKVEGWAAIAIIVRAIIVMTGVVSLPKIPSTAFWMRPFDVFELIAILIVGISVRKSPGGSLLKSIIVSILIAVGWILTARGYFRPF